MSPSPADFNAQVIEEFHAADGKPGGMFEQMPLLLLHHTGAKSGRSYINPLAYMADGDRYVIFGSKGGAPEHPSC
jgi:F420H(2)-dependent quinone reductase